MFPRWAHYCNQNSNLNPQANTIPQSPVAFPTLHRWTATGRAANKEIMMCQKNTSQKKTIPLLSSHSWFKTLRKVHSWKIKIYIHFKVLTHKGKWLYPTLVSSIPVTYLSAPQAILPHTSELTAMNCFLPVLSLRIVVLFQPKAVWSRSLPTFPQQCQPT